MRINFVCYGNICRSPMAEFLFKELVKEKGKEKDYYIVSSATSDEETGNPVHYGTANILAKKGIDFSKKRSIKIQKQDYDKFDLFIGMDENNVKTLKRLFGGDPKNKVKMLLDYTDEHRGVLDPWFTHDFDATFIDITKGLEALYNALQNGETDYR